MDKIEALSINSNTLQKDVFFPKNYKKNNNNINNNNNVNYNNDNNNYINQNISINNNFNNQTDNNDTSSIRDTIEEGSIENNLYSIDNSQLGNESFLSQNLNEFSLLNANNNINNMSGFSQINNNDPNILQNLLLSQQYNNQLNQTNFNNNMLGLYGNNQNILNNFTILNNNANNNINYLQQNNLLLQMTLTSMNIKGWIVFNKVGNKVGEFTSFELFKFLTENILANNIKLDEYIISSSNYNKFKCPGGSLYMQLLTTLQQAFEINEKKMLQEEMIKRNLTNNNFINNVGANNINNLFVNNNNFNNNIGLNNNKFNNNIGLNNNSNNVF